MMYRSFPRYWMVAIASLVMITTLGVEYLRLVLHPIDHTGELYIMIVSTIALSRGLCASRFPPVVLYSSRWYLSAPLIPK